MCEPEPISVAMVRCRAAWPLAVVIAPMPPSRAATRCSRTALVGLLMREYTWPARSRLNSDAAWSLDSKTNEVVRWIGTARAPVAGSGAAPLDVLARSIVGYIHPQRPSPRHTRGDSHEGQRHPAREGQHPLHRPARP